MFYDSENNPMQLRAIIVCVDFWDYLLRTLVWNRHHFHETMIVTSRDDLKTLQIGLECGARVYRTDSFYDDGAIFNKWKALEEALDHFGRHGWMVLLDADILWPTATTDQIYNVGNIYSPYRRMCPKGSNPFESDWSKFPRHRYSRPHEFSGYTMIFHADDPHLSNPPWHETNWRHAGGADTAFQAKWPIGNRIRPEWEVLHLGTPGQWTGRTEPYIDGSTPKDADKKREALRQFMSTRRKTRNYKHEKLS